MEHNMFLQPGAFCEEAMKRVPTQNLEKEIIDRTKMKQNKYDTICYDWPIKQPVQ